METANRLVVEPVQVEESLSEKVYGRLKQAIMAMDVYAVREEIRLDERKLSTDLGVSRTPLREAIQRLEQEGFVRIEQRKGVFVARKTKREILEIITVWAALEGMAARLVALYAPDADIASLRGLFAHLDPGHLREHMNEYSELNIRFHQRMLELGGNALMNRIADNLVAHVRSIRHVTIGEADRIERSLADHMAIIEALEARDVERAERLARQHTLDLATHVENNVDYLD